MNTPISDLVQHTARALDEHSGVRLCVAFSGGGDSSALLDVLARLPQARQRGLRAVHVDHGLNPKSEQWAAHCRAFCDQRNVPFRSVQVTVTGQGQGPEAAAREARFAALARHLQADEALLLAHHQDDQVETIVLKLLRGAGPHGLAGMRAWRRFGPGWLWRPWLGVARATIGSWLAQQQIDCIADPANEDPDMTRSWLRRDILPQVTRKLPQAAASILHSGERCAETRDYLDQQLDTLDALIGDDGSLDGRAWLDLHAALRGLLLERWLHRKGLPGPGTAQRRELERQVAGARADRTPRIHWPGADVRVWRGRLHAMAPLPAVPAGWQKKWDGQPVDLPLGQLRLVGDKAEPDPDAPPPFAPGRALCIRLRRGGEYLHPDGDRCGRELRYIFQQHGLPPWLRPYCPLLYADEELLAVAGLCLTRAGAAWFEPLGVRPEWRYHV